MHRRVDAAYGLVPSLVSSWAAGHVPGCLFLWVHAKTLYTDAATAAEWSANMLGAGSQAKCLDKATDTHNSPTVPKLFRDELLVY